MNKQKVINKGYTLSVTSWENDGDNYNTNEMNFQSKELAVAVAKMCKDLFKAEGGIGNSSSFRNERPIILEYMKAHPELYPDKKNPSDDDLIKICMHDYNSDLMGGSDYYSRVFDSATLIYSPEDVYLETIPF